MFSYVTILLISEIITADIIKHVPFKKYFPHTYSTLARIILIVWLIKAESLGISYNYFFIE